MTQGRTTSAYWLIGSAALGALLGYLGARVVLVGSGLSLVPWALAGLALGAARRPGPRPAVLGAVYGFALAYTFMVAGYDGTAALRTRLLPFALFGVAGAVCGSIVAIAGRVLRRRVSATRPPAAPTGTASRGAARRRPGSARR